MEVALKNNTTESSSSTPTFDNSSYSNKLSNLQNSLSNYNSNINQIKMPKFDTSGMKKVQGDLSSLMSALQTYQNEKSMSKDESNARAYSQLNNQYNAGLDKTLNNYNKDAVSRGMFGQLPVEALKANAMSESELNKASAIGDLGNNMYTQDFNMARQKDSDYYNKVNQQSNLLGTIYNTESDQYNNSVNNHLNSVNLASLKDNNFYNNISNQSNLINSSYGLSQDQYNADLNKYTADKQDAINTMGAYSNDYQAQINALQNDGDTSNDWQIPYLNSLRNDKVTNQDAITKQEMQERLSMLGYADQLTADYYDVPVGTPSEQINLLDYQQNQSKDMLDYKSNLDKQDYLWQLANTPVTSSGNIGTEGENSKIKLTGSQVLDYYKEAKNNIIERKASAPSGMSMDSAVPYAPSNKEITTELVEMFRAMGIDDATASEYLDSLNTISDDDLLNELQGNKWYSTPATDNLRLNFINRNMK